MRVRILTVIRGVAAITLATSAAAQMVPQLPNAPFSAEMVSTRVQTPSDGTHITQPGSTTELYRDSLGRTRSETSFAPPAGSQQAQASPANVTIIDPVEGARYFLNVNNKTARKNLLPKMAQPPAFAPPPAGLSASISPGGPAQAVIPNAIMLYPGHGGPVAVSGRLSGSGSTANRPTMKSEDLGTQTIEGLSAEGHRITTTYLVGTFGNDRDFATTTETFRSAELGIMVLSKTSDPRSGELTEKLVNFSRAEPDPALFQVPSDYTIEEQPAPVATPSGQNGVIVR
jgi:hypothetical protein